MTGILFPVTVSRGITSIHLMRKKPKTLRYAPAIWEHNFNNNKNILISLPDGSEALTRRISNLTQAMKRDAVLSELTVNHSDTKIGSMLKVASSFMLNVSEQRGPLPGTCHLWRTKNKMKKMKKINILNGQVQDIIDQDKRKTLFNKTLQVSIEPLWRSHAWNW